MLAVSCPACSERVEGTSSNELSRSIKSHFRDIHKMDIDVEMNTSDEGCGCGREEGSRSTMAEREGGPSASSGGREEFAGGADAQREGSFESTGPGSRTGMGRSSTSEGTSGISEFECPMCREDIKGGSEEEMSEAFREHLATTHKDEPFVTRLMEKVGGRR